VPTKELSKILMENLILKLLWDKSWFFSLVGFDSKKVEIQSTVRNVTMVSGLAVSEVMLIGSRNPSRTAVESTVPINFLNIFIF